MARITIYDTTLRDGTQREGISLSFDDKIRIATKLDEFGIDYIEGGWPGASPKDSEFFLRARDLKLGHSKLAAFGSTRRPNTIAPDATLEAIAAADTPVVCLFGKSWRLHVKRVLNTTEEENLRMIADSVAYFRGLGREVIYDAEHFFDGFKDDPDHALATIRAAADAGAQCLVLCETNGGALPHEVAEITRRVVSEFDLPIGIHTHNDGELAVANTLAAVQAGATHVQGTINGYGERTGNANLCSIIPNLELKLGHQCLPEGRLSQLAEVSRYVAEVANLAHDQHLPFVGTSSFAHKAGMHVNAVLKDVRSFEHIDPELVGNQRRVLISELGGRSNVLYKAQQLGLDVTSASPEVRKVIAKIKDLENRGFQFEGAEASFELMVRRAQPDYKPPFRLLDMLIIVEQRKHVDLLSEATVKIQVGEDIFHTAAEGNGPVNALDAAIRKALLQFYPSLASVELADYKVRVLNEDGGTSAIVRVSIESTDGHKTWNTVGSSTNIIEASWIALADSLEYPLLTNGAVSTRPQMVTVPHRRK